MSDNSKKDLHLTEGEKQVVSEIVTAAQLYEAALGEKHHVQIRRDQLTNRLLTNIGLICFCLVQHDELIDKLNDAEELVEVLQNSLGEADDKIKALERGASSRKKADKY